MAMCVMAVVGAAPCQCFSPGGNQMTSPGRISSMGPPQCCALPQPAVTINVCPSGCVCHAVRAPGSNVTVAAAARRDSLGWNKGSMRTVPVNQSAGPLADGCEPFLLISMERTYITWTRLSHGVLLNLLQDRSKLRSDGIRCVPASTLLTVIAR